ncbi:MAG: DegT/DnrJ/EryC1/StrS aminotransferase family protein [Treponema sp.]|nr:DegT/DnrJ/EryC1/StrS aminotransferase family protein [Treponema sp.]
MENISVPFFKASIGSEEENAVLNVLRSGWLTTGKFALQFENDFSKMMNNVPEAIISKRKDLDLNTNDVKSFAVSSNSIGLELALAACNFPKESAVITSPYTFVATASCACHLGLDVFFADTEKDSYNIDVTKIEDILKSKDGKRVKAIIPVHIAGNVCNMGKICWLAKKYNLRIIEDCAHALPSLTNLGYAGSIADIGVFSFYATKTITTAEGGMICTRDENLAKEISHLRLHGINRNAWDRYTSKTASWEYDVVSLGYKANLPDILAAIGIEQLKKAQNFLEKRRRIVSIYNKAFSPCDFLDCPPDGEGNAWHLYLVRIKNEKLTISRNDFARKLQEYGIGISVHFIPIYHFTYWKEKYPNLKEENFPNAESQFERTISLPLWPDMTESMIQSVITTVKKIGNDYHA